MIPYKDNMEKRLLVAVALSIFIIITFQYFSPKPVKAPIPAVSPITAAESVSKTEIPEIKTPDISNPSVEEKETAVETDKYSLTFSNVGGSIKKIQLKEYKNLNYNEPLELVNINNPKEYILAISSNTMPEALDTAEYKGTSDKGIITYVSRTKELEITKRYILHKSKYTIDLQVSIKNISSTPRKFSFDIIGASNLKEHDTQAKNMLECSAKIDGKVIKLKAPKIGRVTNLGNTEWVDLKTKYFSMILKPISSTSAQFHRENTDKQMIVGVESSNIMINPGETVENKFVLYAGPSQIPLLKQAGYALDETVDYGFFGGITKVLLVVMGFFHSIVRSWGVSIILLSIFLNIILFPLTMKSFKSIQKMQELHPQMEKLKKENKDNPQKLNKEVMELYKKYKINPLSGCLPMLLQMPIFFALYQALMKSIELRGTSFLWVNDLSSPDFIKLPFTLPMLGNKLHILPLIMVAAMVIQQKISTKTMGSAITEEQKQQQKMMLIMMPIMFGLIFYNMPSGLVLYWIINTVLTVVEQSAVLKKD